MPLNLSMLTSSGYEELYAGHSSNCVAFSSDTALITFEESDSVVNTASKFAFLVYYSNQRID